MFYVCVKHAYWTVDPADESSKLCISNIPAGMYRNERLSFGLTVSGHILQGCMDDMMRESSDGVIGIANDLIRVR